MSWASGVRKRRKTPLYLITSAIVSSSGESSSALDKSDTAFYKVYKVN